MDDRQLFKSLLLAWKIGVGASIAIIIAEFLGLENSVAAGSVTLLTLMTTKWGTVKLSIYRIVTFFLTVGLAGGIYKCFGATWLVYGLFVFVIVTICSMLGWTGAISVNALIGAHFLEKSDFSVEFILNEFQLVLIGVVLAFTLNLIHNYHGEQQRMIENMRFVEQKLQIILGELAAYLSNKDMQRDVWKDIEELEENLKEYIKDANDYQDNTFHSHPGYYINYFEMRMDQCNILSNLHGEAENMKFMPKQAKTIADYILYMADYVVEKNKPAKQLKYLQHIFETMKEEPLPVTREEFESRALLYHMLMDLEDFLQMKARFVENLDEEKLRLYWNE
ncbi:MAG: hypothetical protein IKV59_05730 [Lachnospiraceae bacterium]|nr:hypothetical protein [Lachnospiraceae bacterium]